MAPKTGKQKKESVIEEGLQEKQIKEVSLGEIQDSNGEIIESLDRIVINDDFKKIFDEISNAVTEKSTKSILKAKTFEK